MSLLYNISLWWLSIIITIVECSAVNEEHIKIVNNLPLCCPIGWFLIRISHTSYENVKYDCLSSPLQVASLNISQNVFLTYESTYNIYGYGLDLINDTIRFNGSNGIPKCDEQIFNVLQISKNGTVQIPLVACLVKTATKIAIISCKSSTDQKNNIEADDEAEDKSLTLSFIHKCCRNNYVYNSEQQRCIIDNRSNKKNDTLSYKTLYGKYAIFIDNAIICPKHKVLVEYQVKHLENNFRQQNSYDEYCIESIEAEGLRYNQYLLRVCINMDICKKLACLRRCCNYGEMIVKGNASSYCHRDTSDKGYQHFSALEMSANFSFPQAFGLIHGLDCLKYRLNPEIYDDDNHVISQIDGSLYVPSTGRVYTNQQYCLEKINSTNRADDNKLYTFLCFDTKVVDNERIRFKLYPIGLLISCLFYAITLLIYLLINNLRNLPGKILICLVFNLFMAYLNIALGQLIPTSKQNLCLAFGFLTYFCLMAAFTWMNVMCFDIWQTFGSTRRKNDSFQKRQNRRFLMYSIYGWGLPILITITTVTITSSELLSENLRPNFGRGRCWFTYDTPSSANLLFFSGPLGILFLINFVLFVLTLRYCNRVKREIFRMQSSNMEKPILRKRFFVDKARFAMNTKLFIVMGTTWFLELLSIIFYNRKRVFLWAISDSFNVLLGVLVFIIFVCKKRIWYLVLEKCHLKNTKMGNHHTTTISHQTAVSCMQSTTSLKSLNKIDTNINYLKPLAVKRTPTM